MVVVVVVGEELVDGLKSSKAIYYGGAEMVSRQIQFSFLGRETRLLPSAGTVLVIENVRFVAEVWITLERVLIVLGCCPSGSS